MRSRQRLLTALVLSASAIACATHHPAEQPDGTTDTTGAAEPLENLVLEVENHNWSDVVVYVIRDGQAFRLTQVTAGRNVSLPLLPRHVGAMGIVRLAVHPIGGTSDYTSQSVSLRTGSTLRLTVESNVSRSSVAVW